MSRIRTGLFLPSIALGAVLLRMIFQAYPETAQTLYRNGFFQGYRVLWDYLISSWLPFPAILLFLGLFAGWLIRRGRRLKRNRKSRWLLLSDGLSAIIIWFLVSWGYNYNCPSVAVLMGREQAGAIEVDLQALAERGLSGVTDLRRYFPSGLREEHLPPNVQDRFRQSQESTLQALGFSTAGRVRVREIKPKGTLHHLGISGIYLPFAGEGHAEAGEALIPRLFTIAHEMSHGYGVTDEGEANYMAYRTLVVSEEPALQYAGWMQLLRYSLGALKRWDHDRYESVKAGIPEGILLEMAQIREAQNRYQAWFPETSLAMNDFYLKQQGVDAGVESYDGWLKLVYLEQ